MRFSAFRSAARGAVSVLCRAGLLALLVTAPVTVLAQTEPAAPGIARFSPHGSVKAPREAVARFGTPMVALGTADAPAPFAVDCPAPGQGHWADPYTWAYRFDGAVPGGLRCSFALRAGLQDLAGNPVAPGGPFRFDTGGPALRASLPPDGARDIDERQVFLLSVDALPAPASLAAHLHCHVPGIGELIPVEVLDGAARGAVLEQRRALGYRYHALLFPERDDAPVLDAASLAAAEARLLAVRCARPLPPDSDLHLVWEAGISTPDGLAAAAPQRLNFRTRSAFVARFECERVNPDRGCLPLSGMSVYFSAPVALKVAAQVYLQGADGTRISPRSEEDDAPFVERVRFSGPFPAQTRYTLHLPPGLTDDAGRTLENASRFPLAVATDAAPPLVKFAGTFGIVESSAGAVLPVTVRAVEAPLPGTFATPQAGAPVPGRQWQVPPDNAAISTWLRRVEDGMATRGEWQEDASGRRWRETTGDASVLREGDASALTAGDIQVPATGSGPTDFLLPRPGGAARFEVLGIPLPGPGLHVVEIASPTLGAALLGRATPRYVATAVLVTNLAVHFKWGGADSLVWVTTLDGAQPVAGAALTASDHCTGKVLWQGRSGADGSAMIPAGTLPEPSGVSRCYDHYDAHPLLISARSGNELGFTLSGWNSGIEPWSFNLPTAGAGPATHRHTVLDRSLLRPGETLSMKHYLRVESPAGFTLPARDTWPDTLELRHQGSDEVITQPLQLDEGGIGTSVWATTPDTRPGTWDIRLRRSAAPDEWQEPSAELRVESFRVPTLEAVLQVPAGPQIAPPSVAVDAHLRYLSGGAVAGAPVRIRAQLQDRSVRFEEHQGYRFDGVLPVPGVDVDPPEHPSDTQAFLALYSGAPPVPAPGTRMQETPLTLDAQGSARATLPVPALTRPQSLRAELEYADLNGDRRTLARDVPLWPAAVLAGVRTPDESAGRGKLDVQVLTVNVDGSTHARAPVSVQLFARSTQSYRRRLAGGFYGWDSRTETRALEPSCAGTSDARGRFSCTLQPAVNGEVIIAATTRDARSRRHTATTSTWVYGGEEQWFGAGDADRMDVLPEQAEVAPGGTARLQVRMPFRSATALVTVEREGVLRHFVTTLSGRKPVVEVPIEAHDAPNVYISVLALRGRLPWWRSALASAARAVGLPWQLDGGLPTAQLDLGKPAWKLGVAQLKVGWAAHRLEVAVRPSAAVYAVRTQAPVDITVRRADGGALPAGAELAVVAVDEGLLALRPNSTWALLDAFMRPRGIAVWTGTAQMQVVGKRHYGKKAVAPGGGGAGPARELFDTLLLWQARVPLDAQGRARVAVPLNDTLGAFRVVAVASAGLDSFGTGSAVIRTSQDLMLHAGLPPLVREGDRFEAGFTVRNASARPLTATVQAGFETPGGPTKRLPDQSVQLAPGAAQGLTWPVTVPDGTRLDWQLRATTPDRGPADTLRVTQTITPVLPVRTTAATLVQLRGVQQVPVALPAQADPARGGIAVGLRARLADGLPGVQRHMQDYPYHCLEQSASVAVALNERPRWDALMQQLPRYLDSHGLARYFASDALSGSEVLSAYLLGLSQASGWPVPDAPRARLLAGLRAFVEGRIPAAGSGAADLAVRRVAALAALAQAGTLEPAWLESLEPTPQLWPTVTLLDWYAITQRLPDSADRTRQLRAISTQLRARLDTSGAQLMLADTRSDALPWLMFSPDLAAARLLAAMVEDPAWQPDRAGLARGLLARLSRGHWDTTPANAWGALALRRFSAAAESADTSGTTTLELGETRTAITWPASAPPVTLPWPGPGLESASPLLLRHDGPGAPWALVETRAAVPASAAVDLGYAVTRELLPVSQRTPGVWSAGDVARVRVTVAARAPAQWVVIEDPLPPGAQSLDSGLAGDASLLVQEPASGAQATPVWVERRPDAVRAFYQHLPRGPVTYEYTLRLNTAGRFALPPTHVEAMYAPDVRGDSVATVLEVAGAP